MSDISEFMRGFAILNIARNGQATLTVMVNKSVPDTSHDVYTCPGSHRENGFDDCDLIGTFTTNINGTGAFFWEDAVAPTGQVIALNVPDFDTILANDPKLDPLFAP